jgi:hypothetical protein
MGKVRGYDVSKDYVPCGIDIVDACAECILFYQKRKVAIKALHLRPYYYDKFKAAVMYMNVMNGGQFIDHDAPLKFISTDIERGSKLQQDRILPELWTDYQRNNKDLEK